MFPCRLHCEIKLFGTQWIISRLYFAKWYRSYILKKMTGRQRIYFKIAGGREIIIAFFFFSRLPSSLCVAPCFSTDCPNNITYSSFVLIGCQKMSRINRWTSIHSDLKAARGGRFPCRGTGFPPASPLVCAGLLQICIQDIWADCISLVWFEWTALSCWGLCADS